MLRKHGAQKRVLCMLCFKIFTLKIIKTLQLEGNMLQTSNLQYQRREDNL